MSDDKRVPRWSVEISYQVEVRAADPREAIVIAEAMVAAGKAQGQRITLVQIWAEDDVNGLALDGVRFDGETLGEAKARRARDD